MASSSGFIDLQRMIQNLRDERQELATRLQEIDELFGSLGITSEGGARRRGRPPGSGAGSGRVGRPPGSGGGRGRVGRPPGSGAGRGGRRDGRAAADGNGEGAAGGAATPNGRRGGRRRRRRGSFERSGEESVLEFVRQHGSPNAAEVNHHWHGEGRGGKADNALGRLVREGKLKRVEVKGERGGRYSVA